MKAEDVWNKFTKFAKAKGFNKKLRGEFAYYSSKTGSVLLMIASDKVKILERNGVEEAKFESIDDDVKVPALEQKKKKGKK